MTKEQTVLAGRILKVVRLARNPMMDEFAIKLNCGLTYEEEKEADRWAKAFELAQQNGTLFELAAKLDAVI